MSAKKVIFFITKGNFGGAQRYVYDLATNLPKTAFNTVVACGTKEGASLVEKLKEENIRTIELKSSEREINLKKDFDSFKDLVKIIKEEKPDIVHFNSSKIGFLGSLAVLYLRFRFSIFNFQFSIPRSIFTSHGWAFNEEYRSWFAKLVFYLAHYLTILICDQTIAVSLKTKKDIDWLPFISQKIIVIHNGIRNFKPLKKEEALVILGQEKTTKTIVCSLSELHPNKGLDIALRGISLLPEQIKKEIIYCIAGQGEEELKLKKIVVDLKLENQVFFLGFINEAAKILSGADIFLFPSRTENLPFAILEAGFLKLPIIASAVGGIPEIIKDMRNGILVHPKNPKEIAEALIYLLENKKKQKEFGEEIKKTITNFFSFDKMISETIRVYQILDSRF